MNELIENLNNENNLQDILPVLVLRGRVMFPNISSNFDVGRKASLYAVEKAMENGSRLFVVTQKNSLDDNPTPENVYSTGVVCDISKLVTISDKNVRLQLVGLYRGVSEGIYLSDDGNYFAAQVLQTPDIGASPIEERAYMNVAREKLKDYVKENERFSKNINDILYGIEQPSEFVNIASFNLPLQESVKQTILETVPVTERLEMLSKELTALTINAKLESEIQARVKQNIDKNQKEFYLREQLRAIHSELGDDQNELEDLREKIKAKGMPEADEAKVLKELDRMSRMNSSSPDYTVLRTYLDWVLDLPFSEMSEDTKDLNKAISILEEDHFGLDKVKQRIVEHIAVMKLTGKVGGSILCLVGPPGVGKTSVATSVARALSRKFVRMSLGGVKDEAEIRGHRKTYIGAMPGRIIYALKDAGVKNPVLLLDEIDKLSSDLRGDPASALLEVLDPEQNNTFRDRYIEIPFDLSDVLFITTANTLDTVPQPLLDRMEVIHLDGYTQEEKYEIARRYLVPKRLKINGVPEDKVQFSEDAIYGIIKGYTKEAGVRNLEREIDSVIRKIATEFAKTGKFKKKKVTETSLKEYLGSARFTDKDVLKEDEVGAVNGLAWTMFGGTTLTVEASLIPEGKGEIILTGKLGDVMKESARAAISYIKANAQKYGVEGDAFEGYDIHIHVPEGATPKDGPSAGVTIATAILSAITGKKVRKDVAMTGEITLLGNVLPIGGLKEKSLAAYRAGVYKIVIPEENLKDVEDIPKPIAEKLEIIPAMKVDDVFKVAVIGF